MNWPEKWEADARIHYQTILQDHLDDIEVDQIDLDEGLDELKVHVKVDPFDMDTPFVLVETSTYGQTWITLHKTAQDAADAHVGQEYQEDWNVELLKNFRTGEEFDVVLSARAVPSQKVL